MGIEAKSKNATLSDRQTDMETELVDTCAASHTMSSQISAAAEQVESLSARFVETQLALEKLMGESSRTETNLRAEMIVVEK